MVEMSVSVGEVTLANPIMPASGTFSPELADVIDLNRLGALVTKSATREFRAGNPTPRVAETPSGMLNSIGIPSHGIDYFLNEIVPAYRKFTPPLVASISAHSPEAFASLCHDISVRDVDVIEANISCPNLEAHGKAFAMHTDLTENVMRRLRAATNKPLWAKLTPNVGDIAEIAQAAEAGGADALVVANAILGMTIDTETLRPTLGSVMGGLSGPAVKPLAVRMTYQCAKAVSIPVIGCGGISTARDAVEFLLAGATAVQVGTITFQHPTAMITIIEELEQWCDARGFKSVADLTGAVQDGELSTDKFEAVR
ncbi:MAG: dihydroorotate dehydrogenase [Rhodospirillaceae bacterium]|jgi:dihydroorotate dehydrogenase (NAD+) catalytic subunit|nr:dihydroorotate dehydrogenase [Rhodospirillaceae bacterium]